MLVWSPGKDNFLLQPGSNTIYNVVLNKKKIKKKEMKKSEIIEKSVCINATAV